VPTVLLDIVLSTSNIIITIIIITITIIIIIIIYPLTLPVRPNKISGPVNPIVPSVSSKLESRPTLESRPKIDVDSSFGDRLSLSSVLYRSANFPNKVENNYIYTVRPVGIYILLNNDGKIKRIDGKLINIFYLLSSTFLKLIYSLVYYNIT
jgi:hypothetical protein